MLFVICWSGNYCFERRPLVDDINGKFAWLRREALKEAGVNYVEGLVFELPKNADDGYLAERA